MFLKSSPPTGKGPGGEPVRARLEYRHDSADQRVFFHDTDGFSSYQDTVAAELIYHF